MRDFLKLLLAVAILPCGVFILIKMTSFTGNQFSNLVETNKNQIDEHYISEFSKDNLIDFTITEKFFGESSNRFRRWRTNFMTIENENLSIDIKVPKELYDQYKKGDSIQFYVDKELPSLLLHESIVLVSVFE